MAVPSLHLGLVLLLLALCLSQAAFYFEIEEHEEECFLIRTSKKLAAKTGKMREDRTPILMGNFDHLNSDTFWDLFKDTNLNVMVMTKKDEKLVYKSDHKVRDNFNVRLEAGEAYWLCMQNTHLDVPEEHQMETYETAKVGVDIRVRYEMSVDDQLIASMVASAEGQPRNIMAEEMSKHWYRVATQDITTQLNVLKRHQDFLRIQEAEHRSTAESTFTQIMLWTLAEAALVLSVALGQVFYFRSFLEQKRFMC